MENSGELLKKQLEELGIDRSEVSGNLNKLLNKVSETYSRLSKQAHRHKLVSETFPEFVFIAAADLSEVYYANRGLEKRFDLDRAEFFEDPLGCLQEFVPSGENIFKEKLEGGLEDSLAGEFKIKDDLWLRAKLIPCPIDGETAQYLVGIFRDVTEEKKSKKQLVNNIDEQKNIILDKIPGTLQKNIALVKTKLRQCYREHKQKGEGDDCEHCLVWVQAVDIAYENIRHHSQSEQVDMFSYLKQLCQYVISLKEEKIEPPALEVQELMLPPDRAISCGIFQFEAVMALYENKARDIRCQLGYAEEGYRYRISWQDSDINGKQLKEVLYDNSLEALVEAGLQGEFQSPLPAANNLEVVFPG